MNVTIEMEAGKGSTRVVGASTIKIEGKKDIWISTSDLVQDNTLTVTYMKPTGFVVKKTIDLEAALNVRDS